MILVKFLLYRYYRGIVKRIEGFHLDYAQEHGQRYDQREYTSSGTDSPENLQILFIKLYHS